ncbi:MFS transporter [Kribbella shirazensis]|uniref:MFS family permease n=1 Tax=Kribbella shirazensis TaxID=1105143 RepID=A0A7X6A526_9ACTN|nr:MFS transporter [Kribbella shirazensis]NIK61518.1 MFS family permease [Kribbella shirazensis]
MSEVIGSASAPPVDAEHRRKGRRALRAAMFGFFVDMYDVYLPVIALAPAISYFSASGSSSVEMATLTAGIFAASLIGRPLGSIIFGSMGDRLGRRRTTIVVAAGFTVCTGLIALLPSYASIGVLSPVLLVLLRLLDGVFLGGEYTAANPLAMEYAPRHLRGLYGSLLNVGYPAALGVITLITIFTLSIAPGGGPASPYAVWGWRIPFAVGFVISGALFVYYLRSVPESELWTKMPKVRSPLRTLFSGRNLRRFGTAFVVGSGAWLTLDGTVGVFAAHFKKLGTDVGVVNSVVLISALLGVCTFPLIGAAGQRFGRREVFLVLGAVNIVVTPLAMGLSVALRHNRAAVTVLAVTAIVGALAVWAMITAYIMEMFPTEVRSSGYGIAYSLPSIIPAFYTYYMLGLGNFMSYDYTPVVIIAVGGVLLLVGAWISKDLRHVDLENA